MLPTQFLASSEIHSEWTWSEKDNFEFNPNCGHWNYRVDGKKITFSNDNFPSLLVKGTQCLRPGFVHYWQMKITERGRTSVPRDEKIRIGILTSSSADEYGQVLLSDLGNIETGDKLYRYMPDFEFPVTIGILLDLIDYRLWFFKDGHCMGISPFDDKHDHVKPVVIVVNGNLTVQLERCLKSRQRMLSSIKEPAWKAESFFISTNPPQWTWDLWGASETVDDGFSWEPISLNHNRMLLGSDVLIFMIGKRPLGELIHRWDIDIQNIALSYHIIVGVSGRTKSKTGEYDNGLKVWGLGNDETVYQPDGDRPSQYYGIDKGRVSVIFDGQLGTLTYFLNGRFLQQPFDNLMKETPLHPIISISTGRNITGIPFSWSNPTWGFGTLQKRCMGTILKSLHRREDIEKLPLPKCIMNNFDTFR